MNPLLHVEVSLYLEIKDSEMYGGQGSVGYAMNRWVGVHNLEKINDNVIENTIDANAGMMGVPVENVNIISKDEYEAATYDDEYEEDYEDDELT